MAKTRRGSRKKKNPSSRKSIKNKLSKIKKNNNSSSSETSPFKGFDSTGNTQSVVEVKRNNLQKCDSGEDKDEIFDKLLNDGFTHHFTKNIRTYYNKKKEQTNTNTLLEFNDCRNRDNVIRWLNDNHNVFNRLTQTQNDNLSQECDTQFDLPSVSQQGRLNRCSTRLSRHKLRAKSLDITVKKNVSKGRNKRHSLPGDSPDFGNYSIEEVNTDEEFPVSAKKEAINIIDLIEDEYLDNIEREIMQQDENKLNDWKRIKDFNKSITTKKPKQLKVKVEESPRKDLLNNNNRTYDYDILENYFIENMQKLIDEKNEKKNCSNVEIVSYKNTLQVGRHFLTMLKNIKEIDECNLNEFQSLFKEIKMVFGDSTRDFGAQTEIETTQVVPNFRNVQVQTVPNLINSSTQTDRNETKIHKFIQTIVNDKASIGLQTDEMINQKNDENVFDDDLDFDFNSEELLKRKDKVEESQSKNSVLIVSAETNTSSKGTKRTMFESPESIRKTIKRPCSDLINNDLSVVFSTCVEDEHKEKILPWSEASENRINKSDRKEGKTQEQIEELENMIDEAMKHKSPIRSKVDELDDNIECFNEFTEGERTSELFASDMKTPQKKSSRRSLFESKKDDVFSNSIFSSDKYETVVEDRTIVEENSCKITILENIVLRSAGTDKQNNFCEDDFVDSTPLKSLVNSRESQLDVTLPPPLEFQDNEKNILLTTPRRPLAIINKITSTPVSQKPQSESFPTLSPISCHGSQKKIKNNRENRKLANDEISKFSPLTIIKNPQDRLSSTPKQKTILNYIRLSQENDSLSLSNSFDSNRNKPCIASSRIPKDQIIAISSLTYKKLATYSSSFTPQVTHLIVSVNERNCLKDHTIKFISAVASGIWVLNFNWIQECLKKNAIVPEEPFEVLDVSGNPGPRNSRLLRVKKPLLKGYTIYPAPPFASTTQQEIEIVIRLLGGKVAPSPEYLLDKHGNFCVIVTEARATQDFELYETWLCALKVVTVDIEWLSRSIGQYQLLSLRPFSLCSDDQIESLGYPPELTANMTYSFSQQTFSTVPSST